MEGADSVVFLREALKRVHDAGYGVANIDASLILAAPKIGPHAAAIRVRVATVVGSARRLRRLEGEDSGRAEFGKRRGRACGGAAGEAGQSEEAAENKPRTKKARRERATD